MDSYRDITGPDGALARLEPFTGNSMSARGDVNDDAGYSVYSYGTEIARVVRHPETGRLVRFYAEENRWGTTTGRHLGTLGWLPGEPYPLHSPRTGERLDAVRRLREWSERADATRAGR